MKTILIKGLTAEQADEMRQAFSHAVYLRKQISKVLQEKIDSARKASISKDAYQSANWAYLQADAVGYERAMQEVLSILEADTNRAVRDEESAAFIEMPSATPRKRGRPKKIS